MSEDQLNNQQTLSPIFAEAIIDRTVNEDGESMYLVKWTDSWLTEKIVSKSFPKLLSRFKEDYENSSAKAAASTMIQLESSETTDDKNICYDNDNDDKDGNNVANADLDFSSDISDKETNSEQNTIGTRSKSKKLTNNKRASCKVTNDPHEELVAKIQKKLHTTVRLYDGKFPCNQCDRSFYLKSLLEKHLATSCGQKLTSSNVIQAEAKNVSKLMNSVIQSSIEKANHDMSLSNHVEKETVAPMEVNSMLLAVIEKSSTDDLNLVGIVDANAIEFDVVDESTRFIQALDLATSEDLIKIYKPHDIVEALNLMSTVNYTLVPESEKDQVKNIIKTQNTPEQVKTIKKKQNPTHVRERSSKYATRSVNSSSNKLRVSCNVCNKVMLKSQLKSHRKDKHQTQYPCTSCGNIYHRPCDLKKHQRHPCGQKKEFIKLQKKTDRLLAKRNEKPRVRDYTKTPCDICGKMLSKGRIKEHKIQVHFNNGQFPCEVCGKRFAKQAVLDYHMLIHGEKKFECEFCGQKFSQRASFHRHRRTHTVESNWMCDCCFKTFKYKFDLSTHCFTDHADIAQNPLPCCVCKEMLKVPNSVYRHSVAHTGVKSHECNICQKKFKGQQVLQKHLRMHERVNEEGPGRRKTNFTRVYGEFNCDICGRTFTLKAMLTRHKNKHLESTAEEYAANQIEREALTKEKKRQYKRQYKLKQKQKLQMLNVLGVDPNNPIVKTINFKNWIETDGTETIIATSDKLRESEIAIESVMSDNSSDMVEQEVVGQQINLEDGYALLNLLRNSGTATGQDDVDFFAS